MLPQPPNFVHSLAEGCDTFFADSPNLIEVSPASNSCTRHPSLQEVPVQSGFVVANLLGPDVFFVQKTRNRLWRVRADFARDIDAISTKAEITVRLRQSRKSISFQDGPNSWRVSLVHFIDSNNQRHVDPLFHGQPAKESVLGAAGSATFMYDHQRAVDIRIPAIWEPTDKSRRRAIVNQSGLKKGAGDFTGRFERNWIEHVPRTHPGLNRSDRYPPMCTMVLDAGTKSASPMW